MGCCSQRRAEIKNTLPTTTTPESGITQPVTDVHHISNTNQKVDDQFTTWQSSMKLRYLENSPILVRGLSGRQYEFSSVNPCQSVDARDAKALLRTRFFRQGC